MLYKKANTTWVVFSTPTHPPHGFTCQHVASSATHLPTRARICPVFLFVPVAFGRLRCVSEQQRRAANCASSIYVPCFVFSCASQKQFILICTSFTILPLEGKIAKQTLSFRHNASKPIISSLYQTLAKKYKATEEEGNEAVK